MQQPPVLDCLLCLLHQRAKRRYFLLWWLNTCWWASGHSAGGEQTFFCKDPLLFSGGLVPVLCSSPAVFRHA
eukprot:357792-Chlamydomonas_euryale.AAC.2